MIHRQPQFYARFRCLGGDCPLTCCRDWSIVPDEEALEDYKTAPAPLGELIARNLVTDEDGDVCFRLRPDGLCALLDGDGLCPIQRHWGEEHLCGHCAAYPRFIEEYGCLTESCQAVSCPEAARLVMEEGIFPLAEWDDGGDEPPFDGVDGELLDGLVATRARAFALLGRKDASIWARLGGLLPYADALQDCIDCGDPLTDVPDPRPTPGVHPFLSAVPLLRRMAALDPLTEGWPLLLKESADALSALTEAAYDSLTADYEKTHPNWEAHLERFACCFLFRHWPKVVNDDNLYGRAALAAASCVALHHLALAQFLTNGAFSREEEILLWARFSRELEHLDENFDTLTEELWDMEVWPLL